MPEHRNTGRPLQLKWQRTWSYGGDDFTAKHPDCRSYCRIFKVSCGPQRGRWTWAAGANETNAGTGYEETPRAAALAAELALFTQFARAPTMRSDT
jgi:hypothetical protein